MERELYNVEELPVFQNMMYSTYDEARNCSRGDIRLVQNSDTGMICNAAFRSELMTYDRNYQNEQALSQIFLQHLDKVAGIVEHYMGRSGLVEVGCGKGFFLEMLRQRGCDISGFDPAYEGDNPDISRSFFSDKQGIRADGLILRHVLEHVEAPVDFLEQLSVANGGTGLIYIEVPCFDWIIDHHVWFDVFYEHVNYFRLSDFYRMFNRVVTAGRLFGGQYLFVIADLSTLRTPVCGEEDMVSLPVGFADIPLFEKKNDLLTIWGGASKGVIFSLFQERHGHPVDMIIDINPAKQGKFIPATALRVQSPEEAMRVLHPGSSIFVMNPNYLEEINRITSGMFNLIRIDHV